ncbi:MAG: TetR/AcrR family transcriptional regulator [Actinomycetota bacterium]|nr:TetR/AcrR family transcriptional regulator [Actinomycetota bacterium]
MPVSNPLEKEGRSETRASGRGRSRQLDRAKIVAAARELARSSGASGLTMRGIARHLGVDPAALYWHFADKAELLDAIARDAVDERAIEVGHEGPWQARARDLCHALAERLRADPALQVMGRSDASLGPFYASATGAAGRLLAEAGLEGEDLVFSAHTLVHTVTAVLSAQSAQASSDVESVRRYMRGVADALPEAESERWVEVARRDPTHSFDAYLDHAVGIVIAGIETRAGRAGSGVA